MKEHFEKMFFILYNKTVESLKEHGINRDNMSAVEKLIKIASYLDEDSAEFDDDDDDVFGAITDDGQDDQDESEMEFGEDED